MTRKRAPLPPPCPLCRPHDGAWMETEHRNKYGTMVIGYERCSCPRGRALAAGPQRRRKVIPQRDSRMEAANDGK
jgi:hypothetical protein